MATGAHPHNIKTAQDLCTGCGSCQGICPKGAISLEIDSLEGFYKPNVDSELCTECGQCLKVCPGEKMDFHSLEQSVFGRTRTDQLLGVFNNCYVGHSTDSELRFASSSGGLVTELLRTVLDHGLIDGVAVTAIKMNPNGELQPTPYIARTSSEVMSAIASKYAPVATNTCISEIMRTNGRYALVGLPCHIHGIRKMQDTIPVLKKRIVFCLGLFCAKNIRLTGTYYLLEKLKIDRKKIKSLSYRGQGWPGGMSILCHDGSSYFLTTGDYYKPDFDAFTIPRCSVCCDQTNELADLSCGDAWHIVKNDFQGSSVIIVRSAPGTELISYALRKARIKLTEADPGAIIKSQGGFKYKKRDIAGRITLRKAMGKRSPEYIGIKYTAANATTYINAISTALKMTLASKKELWPFLKLYCNSTAKLANLYNK